MQGHRNTISRRERWQRLEALIGQADRRGLSSLGHDDLKNLGRLYRSTAGDLARVRTLGADSELEDYLNGLVARGHSLVYAPPVSGWTRIRDYFATGYSRLIIQHWRPMLAAIAIFVLSAVFGYVTSLLAPEIADAIFPQVVGEQVYQRFQDNSWFNDPLSARPLISSAIFTNNARVAILAFAFGITLGVGTIFMLATNGLMLGAVAARFASAGHAVDFWATILPHGVIELTAICLAGGAGLLMASGVLLPGDYRRTDALVRASRDAARILLGVILLLLVAGLIEGFYSTAPSSNASRLLFAGFTGILLFPYLLAALWAVRLTKKGGKRHAVQ